MRFISTFIAVFFTFLAFSQKNGTNPIPLAQDLCVNAEQLCKNITKNSSLNAGINGTGESITGIGALTKGAWYKFRAFNNGNVTITLTNPASRNMGIELFTGACGAIASQGVAVGATNLTFTVPVVDGTDYLLLVGTIDAGNVSFSINARRADLLQPTDLISGVPEPSVSPDPFGSRQLCLSLDTMTVINTTPVNGTNMSYQWFVTQGLTPILPFTNSSGADTTFSFAGSGITSGGQYNFGININNECGNAFKAEVVDIIKMVPAFTFLPDPICINTPVTFTPDVQIESGAGTNPAAGTLTYLWNFDDPNSGLNDTSTQTMPIHTFIGTPPYPDTFMVKVLVNSTDPLDCPIDSVEQAVIIAPPLDVNTADTTFACKGDTAVSIATPINGTPAFTYVWTFSGTSPACVGCNLLNTGDSIVRLANAPDGTYELALFTEDGQGCFAFDTVTVVVGNPDVNIRVTGPLVYDPRFIGDTICPYSQIDYDTTHVSGTGPFTFTWGGIGLGNVSSGSDASISATTQVTLFVTDPLGCISDTDTVTINVYPPATITPDPQPICADDLIANDSLDVILTVAPTLNNISWATSADFGRILQPIPATNADSNMVTVRLFAPADIAANLSFEAIGINSVTGCIDTIMGSIVVDPPINLAPTPVAPDTVCAGDTIALNAVVTGPGIATIFQWTNITGGEPFFSGVIGSSQLDSIIIPNVIVGTDYRFRIVASNAAGCSDTDTVVVHVRPIPSPNITRLDSMCLDLPIRLRGNPGIPGQINDIWTQLSGPPVALTPGMDTSRVTFQASVTGTYVYEYRVMNGACSAADTITLVIDPLPQPSLSGSYYRNPFCADEELVFVELDTAFLSYPPVMPIFSAMFTTPAPPPVDSLTFNGGGVHPNIIINDGVNQEFVDTVRTATTYTWEVIDIKGCVKDTTFAMEAFTPARMPGDDICIKEPSGGPEWLIDFLVELDTKRSDTSSVDGYVSNGISSDVLNPHPSGNDSLMSRYRYVEWISLVPPAGGDNRLNNNNVCFQILTLGDAGATGTAAFPNPGLGFNLPDSVSDIPLEQFMFDSLAFATNPLCPLGAWTFNLLVYDGATGCTDEITAEVNIGDKSVVDFTQDTITQCLGDVGVLRPNIDIMNQPTESGHSYSWDVIIGGTRINGISSRDSIGSLDTLTIANSPYTFILTTRPNINGITVACSDTDTIVITVVPLPVMQISPIVPVATPGNDTLTLCAVSDFRIGTNIGITAGQNVRWFYGNDTTLLIGTSNILFVDTFTVSNQVIMKFTNEGGCSALDTVQFNIIPLPDTTSTVSVTTANSLLPNSTCGNDTVTFSVTLTNPAPATNRYYLQNTVTGLAISDTVPATGGGTLVTLRTVLADTTTITIIAFNTTTSCDIAFNDTITINVIPKPIAVVQADQDVCSGTVFKIDGSGSTPQPGLNYTFFRTDTSNNVTINPTADSLLVTITQDSVFMLQVTEIATGCISDLDSIRFTVIGSTQAFAGVDTFICAGATYNIADATNIGTTILWTAKSGNPFNRTDTINPTYTPLVGVTGIDSLFLTVSAAGCPDALDTMLLNVVDGARANIISALPNPICSGDTIFLVGSVFNADSAWSSSSVAGLFEHPKNAVSNYYVVDSALGQTNVTLSLIAFNGPALCPTDTARVTVNINNGPIAAGGNDTTICQGTSLNLANARVVGTNINWSSSLTAGGAFNNNASANPIFTPLVGFTGTDTLIVTSSNVTCPDSKTDTIIVTVSPAAFAQINTVLTPNTICSGDTLPLFGTVLNADSLWTTNNIVGSFSNNKNTTTTFVLDTALGQTSMKIFLFAFNGPVGCATDTDSITVTITNGPITALLALDTICQGTALNLSGNTARVVGGNINWSSSLTAGGSFSNNSSATPVFTPLATFNGLDTLVVTSRNAACPKTVNDTLVLRVQAAPVAIITATRDTTCEGFGYQLNSTTQNGVIKWTTSGFGTFDFDNISNPIYTSAANDPFNVQLNISVEGAVGGGLTCGNAKDSITLQVTKIATATIDKATLTLTNNVLTACNGFDTEISATVSLASDSVLWTSSPLGSLIIDNTDPINITITPDPNFTGQAFLFLKAFNAPCDTVRDTLELNVLDGPSFTINPIDANGFAFATDTSCAFEQREIQLNVNNPNPAYSYYLIKPVNDTLGKFENFPGNTPSFIVSPDTTTNFTVSVSAANCSVDSNILINVHRIPTAILPSSIDSVCLNDGVYNAVANITNETEGGFWSHTGSGSWLLNDSIGKSVNYQLAGADTLNLIGLTFTPTDVTRCGLTAFTRPASMSLLVKPNAYFGGISPLSAFTSSVPDQVKFVNDTLYVQQGMKSIIIQADVFNTPGLTWAKSSNAKGTIKNLQRIGNTESIEYRFDKKDGNFSSFYITATPTSECNPLGPDTIHVVFNRISTVNVITPNGDGVNDVLRFNGYAEGGSLVIFDRWGLKVYETNNYRNNWDGEVVEDDTYFYIFKFNGENYTGYVRVMSER